MSLPENLTGLNLPQRFTFGPRIGAGAMGEVFRATAEGSDRSLAVKVIRPEMAADPKFVARFVREARALERVQSPHVVRVVDLGVARANGRGLALATDVALDTNPRALGPDQLLYMAMQWLEGEPLDQRIKREGGLTGVAALELATGLLDALAAAHAEGLVHRDVKPGNIIVAERQGRLHPWLIDFGIVKSLDGDLGASLTTGFVAGTPQYFSPEQARGEAVTADVDLWALGVTLYHALTRKYPYEAATMARLIVTIGREPPRPLQVEDCPKCASPQLVALVNGLLTWPHTERLRSLDAARELLRRSPENLADEPPTLQMRPLRRPSQATQGVEVPPPVPAMVAPPPLEEPEFVASTEVPARPAVAPQGADPVAGTLAMTPLVRQALAETVAMEPLVRPVAEAPRQKGPRDWTWAVAVVAVVAFAVLVWWVVGW
ncbi:MAG: serine/threonine protein kinase [Deltaproteobacteria bacterium]|nr:serine/threonine protein kinase [Deltaproteobacteria bacterium]